VVPECTVRTSSRFDGSSSSQTKKFARVVIIYIFPSVLVVVLVVRTVVATGRLQKMDDDLWKIAAISSDAATRTILWVTRMR